MARAICLFMADGNGTVNIPLGAAGSLRSRESVAGQGGPFPSSMLYPPTLFELVSAHPYLAGTSPNAHFLAGLNKIKCYYDPKRASGLQTSPHLSFGCPAETRLTPTSAAGQAGAKWGSGVD